MPILFVETNQHLDSETTTAFLDEALDIIAGALDKPRKGIMARVSTTESLDLGEHLSPAAYLEIKAFAFPEGSVAKIIEQLTMLVQKHLNTTPENQFHEYIVMEPSMFGWNGNPC